VKLSNLYEQVTNKIVAELEAGAVPWTRPWKYRRTGSIMPQNFATGRPYSGVNIPILWGEAIDKGYERHQWLTFKQAQDLGGMVRKGEHGTVVVFTKKIVVEDDDDARSVSMLRTFVVFNVAQIDGLTFPAEPDQLPEVERIASAESFVAATHADIRIGGNQPMYVPSTDFIAMPALVQFRDANAYYATLLHECGHWTGAGQRLNRDLKGRFGTSAYAAEELIAELAAAFLCAHIGIQGELRHAGYIGSWIRLLKEDDRAIFTAASKASQAADYLRQFSAAAVDGADPAP
jgi:antirestriction protein ArdC